MTIIHLILEGDDDGGYSIITAFSDKSMAYQFVAMTSDKQGQYGCYRTESIQLDIYLEALNSDKKLYLIRMYRDGRHGIEWRYTLSQDKADRYVKEGLNLQHPTLDEFYLWGYVYARDPQQAIEIANKKREQLIADRCWPGE
jgi:hypothetical protein